MSISAANGIENCKLCVVFIFIDTKKSLRQPQVNKNYKIIIQDDNGKIIVNENEKYNTVKELCKKSCITNMRLKLSHTKAKQDHYTIK